MQLTIRPTVKLRNDARRSECSFISFGLPLNCRVNFGSACFLALRPGPFFGFSANNPLRPITNSCVTLVAIQHKYQNFNAKRFNLVQSVIYVDCVGQYIQLFETFKRKTNFRRRTARVYETARVVMFATTTNGMWIDCQCSGDMCYDIDVSRNVKYCAPICGFKHINW